MNQYGVKLLLTHSVGEQPQRFYEEMVLLVQTDDFDSAFTKAEAYAATYESEYINPWGQTVTVSVESINCFQSLEPQDDVQEVYSSFSVNRSALSKEQYYEIIADVCGSEDLYPLRNALYNTLDAGESGGLV